jgi:hypothetical protein
MGGIAVQPTTKIARAQLIQRMPQLQRFETWRSM